MLEAAECNVSEGERVLPRLGAISAVHWMARGLDALRKGRADEVRIKKVHLRLLELQSVSRSEMQTLDPEFERIPGFLETQEANQKAAAAHVSGYEFFTAIGRFAHVCDATDVVALKGDFSSADHVFNKVVEIANGIIRVRCLTFCLPWIQERTKIEPILCVRT